MRSGPVEPTLVRPTTSADATMTDFSTDTSLQTSLYDTDIVTWAERQVAELRRVAASAPSNAVDWENVIEEIECVGRSEWKGVESQLIQALAHVLKGFADRDSLGGAGWPAEVSIALDTARHDYRASMRRILELDAIWRLAGRRAAAMLQTYAISIPPGIPATCPFTLDEMLDESFTYDGALRRLADLVEARQKPL